MTAMTIPHLRMEDGSLAEGSNVAGYRVVKRLGKGGFGVVYLAENDIGQKVALKQFLMHGAGVADSGLSSEEREEKRRLQEWALRRFKETTRDLAELDHPNIVKVLNYVPLGDTAVMMMSFVDGTTLEDGIRASGGVLSLATLRPYIEPIFDAFEYLHTKGLVHRDFKTDNIMIRKDGVPVLIDFGSLKMIEREFFDRANDISSRFGRPTTTYAVVSQGYAAPEQYNPLIRPQPTMDVYAMGSVLYRTVVGEPPVDALKRDASRLTGTIDPLRPLVPDLSKALDVVGVSAIGRALALSPSDRPQTMAAFRTELGWTRLSSGPQAVGSYHLNDGRALISADARQVAYTGASYSSPDRGSQANIITASLMFAALVVLLFLGAIVYFLVANGLFGSASAPAPARPTALSTPSGAVPATGTPAPPGASVPLEAGTRGGRLDQPPPEGVLGRVPLHQPGVRNEEAPVPTLRRDLPLQPNPPRNESFSPPAVPPQSVPPPTRPIE